MRAQGPNRTPRFTETFPGDRTGPGNEGQSVRITDIQSALGSFQMKRNRAKRLGKRVMNLICQAAALILNGRFFTGLCLPRTFLGKPELLSKRPQIMLRTPLYRNVAKSMGKALNVAVHIVKTDSLHPPPLFFTG